MDNIKLNIAKNITNLRVSNKLTQLEFGEKLNYTDKSVSKWENGDATPPIETLDEIAKFFGVTIDYLTHDNSDNSEMIKTIKKTKTNKLVITLLAVSLVWLISTISYVYLCMFSNYSSGWKVFIYAIPLSFIVLLVFNCIWGYKKLKYILVSLIVWTILLAIYIAFLEINPWLIFLIGIPLQISAVLWSQLHKKK